MISYATCQPYFLMKQEMWFAQTYKAGQNASWVWILALILLFASYPAGYTEFSGWNTKSQAFPTVKYSRFFFFLLLKKQYEWWLSLWTQADIYSVSLEKKSHLPLDPERTEFLYQLLPNKMNVFHNQNYKTSPHFSGKTVLKRLFIVCRRSYSSAVLHPFWKKAL